MKFINGNDLGLNINFPIKVIDIDFYNTTKTTLFFGHVNDNNFTVLHLIIPKEYDRDNINLAIRASFYNKTLDEPIITVPVNIINQEPYIFLTNGDILNSAYNGELQFFIIEETNDNQLIEDAEQLIASSNKIPYIVEESLSLEISKDEENAIQTYITNNENTINQLFSMSDDMNDLKNDMTDLENEVTSLGGNINNKLSFNSGEVDGVKGIIIPINHPESNNESQFFLSTLGALKVRTKTDGVWPEVWDDFEVGEQTTLTPEMIQKINSTAEAISNLVELKRNKITSTYNDEIINSDVVHYPSLSFLDSYTNFKLNELYEELYDDIYEIADTKADSPNLNGSQSYLDQIITTDNYGKLQCSKKKFGDEDNFYNGLGNINKILIPTEQSVINYVSENLNNINNELDVINDYLNINSIEHRDFITFNNLKEISDNLITASENNFFLLQDTLLKNNENENNFKLTVVGNCFILNGVLTEDTTFTIPCRNSSDINLMGNNGPHSRIHFLFYDMYDKNLNILPISGSLTYQPIGYSGTAESNFDSTQQSCVISDNICYLAVTDPSNYDNIDSVCTYNTNYIMITIGEGNYNNETFSLIGQFTKNSINSIISDISENQIKIFNINENILPEKITNLLNRTDIIETNINTINDTLDEITIGGTTLSSYNIEDAYTKDQIEERDLNFIEPSSESKIILKNKVYYIEDEYGGNLKVEVKDWHKIHIEADTSAQSTLTISLDSLFYGDSRHKYLLLKEINGNLSDNQLSLKLQYFRDTYPVTYTRDIKTIIGTYDYIDVSNENEFIDGSLSITASQNTTIDYTFSLQIFDTDDENNFNKYPIRIKDNLLEDYSYRINNYINNINNISVHKDELYMFSDSNELLNFTSGTYHLSPAAAQIVTKSENSSNEINIYITGNTKITNEQAVLSLTQDITLEHNKLYNIIIYCKNDVDNRAVDFTLNTIKNNNIIPYKEYHLDNNYDDSIDKINYINDRVFIDSVDDVIINSITCMPKIASRSIGGTYYISIRPSAGVIKEECLGLERFIENGEVNTLMENYSNSSTHKLVGTYQLNNDYCYLSVNATFPSGQLPAIYPLPVASTSNVTALATGTEGIYKVLIQIQNGDSNTTYIKISPLNGGATTATDTAQFTLCYKYK